VKAAVPLMPIAALIPLTRIDAFRNPAARIAALVAAPGAPPERAPRP